MKEMRIRIAGELFDNIVINGCGSACGGIRGGLSATLEDSFATTMRGGCVLNWEDFEAVYLEVKAIRETPEWQAAHLEQVKRFGPGNGGSRERPRRALPEPCKAEDA